MKPRFRTLFIVAATTAPLFLCSLALAATVTYDADTATVGTQDGAGLGWNTTAVNFWDGATNVLWPNATNAEAVFGTADGAADFVTVGTVQTNKITFNAPGSGNYTLTGGTITLGGTAPAITATVDATVDSVLAGTAGMTKAGAGVLALGGNNTLTGELKLTAGTLRLTGAGGNQIADTSLMNVGVGSTLDLNGRSETVRQLTNSGGTVVNPAGTQSLLTLNIAGNGEQNFAGSINGNIRVAVTNSTTKNTHVQWFNGTSSYTGGTLIDNGHLRVTSDAALGAVPAAFDAANITLRNGGVLQNRDSNLVLHANRGITLGTGGGVIYVGWNPRTMTIDGVISGSANLTKLDSGTLFLNGANTYTGTTTISAGTLQLGTGGTTGSLATASAITNNATLAFFRSDDISQGVHFSGAPITGTGSINKLGTAILTLNAANTFGGSTTITAGTLRLDYTSQNNSKLSDTAALVFGPNAVTLDLAGGSHTEVVSATTLNTASSATITRQPGSTAVIQLGTVTRNAGASLTLAEAGIATTSNLNTAGGILGTWAMVGNDWAMNSTNAANGPITAFTAYVDYTRLSSGAKVIADDPTANIQIIEGTGPAGDLSLAAATTHANSLKHSATGGGTAINLGANTLRLGVSGGILTNSGGAPLTIGTTPGLGILSAGGNVSNTAGEIFLNQEDGSAITINSSIVNNGTGAVALGKIGSGNLILAGANTYTGASTILGGTVTFPAGSSLDRATTGDLKLGGAVGKGVLNLNTEGSVRFSTIRLGGENGTFDSGKGAVNQTAGTVYGGGNLELGMGVGPASALTDTYGSYVLSGGSLSTGRTRIGNGGLGVVTQSSGTWTIRDYLVIGASDSADSYGTGVATFTGGSAVVTGNRILLSDRKYSTGTLNIGTLAGGNGSLENNGTQEATVLGNAGSRSATVNLNSGTLVLGGPLKRNTGNNDPANISAVNFNGGTLKAKGGTSLIDANPLMKVNVFNGGMKVDTQANNTTIGATLLATTGNGIYPAGGTVSLPSPDGAGYIGAPIVTVSTTGAGTGATAIANVVNGEITGVTLTCPGQGYVAGDTVSFSFAGGGFDTAAVTFAHTLQPTDLAANGSGGFTKLGSGNLTVSGTDVFGGLISVEGKLTAGNLSLGSAGLKIVNFLPNASSAPLQATTSITTTAATVPVEITGTFSLGTWPVISYPFGGAIGGNGAAALQLNTGTLPRGVVATLVDNPDNGSVDLAVTAFNPLTWKGTTNGVWDINTTTNWTIGATPEKFLNNDVVLFDDSVGTGSTSVVLDTTVSPASVTFDNDTKNYTLSGSGGISGTTGLTKGNNGILTILNANTYSGTTAVNAGTLRLGDGTTNGGITGPLANEATVEFNPAGSATFPGDISGSSGTFIKTGSGTQILTGANPSTGVFQINGGILQIGNGTINGGNGNSHQIAAGASLRLERATVAAPNWSNITGEGTIALNCATSGDWGNLTLPAGFTGTLRVEKGRVGTGSGTTAPGGTSLIQILAGAQLLNFSSVESYTTPIEIAGDGWGETGYPGGLRLAAGATATWEGSVTLTADSGIHAQRTANFTVTGAITGAYQCQFYAGDPQGDSGTLTVAPLYPVQNSYASTKINGRPNGVIVAGNPYAFSTGPLEVVSAILKLDGNSLTFASLSGTGGVIGNYNDFAPVVLTVGDGSSTAYAGVIRDGGTAPLALVKTGAGTLSLTGSNTYTGNTTIGAGVLSMSTPFLADTSTVSVAAGAQLDLNTGTAADTVAALVLGGVSVPPGTYNSSHATYGSFFTGTGSIVIVGGYDSWATDAGLTAENNGPLQDPDHDGTANLMEFYLDGNPLASDPAILPARALDATYLTLTFSRRDDAEADVATQAVQYGSDLSGWTGVPIGAVSAGADANGVIVDVSENGDSPDTITVRIPRALAPSGKLFGRVQVSK